MDETVRQHIVDELDLKDEPQEVVDEVITTLGGLIMQSVIVRVAEQLDDENVIEFEQILSEADGETKQAHITAFLIEKVPQLDDLVASCSREVIEEFKKLGESEE